MSEPRTFLRVRSVFAALTCAAAPSAFAAEDPMPLPAPSPLARVFQAVGVSSVQVEYSSPGVKGRTIWGELVPWDKMWRTGANAATKLTLSHDATVAGKAVPAGTYSLHTIPGQKEWTFILNKDADAGERTYDKGKDVLRVKLKTETSPARERMTFLFSDTTDTETRLDLDWAGTRLSVPIAFDTAKLAKANVAAFLATASRKLAGAARHQHEKDGDLAAALATIDRSIAVEETWFNVWTKAELLSKKGDKAAAYAHAKKAWDLGQKAEFFFWKDQVKAALDTWPKE